MTRIAPSGAPLDADGVAEARPVDPLFEKALMATLHASDPLRRLHLELALGMSSDEGRARADVGVFSARVDRFKLTVNWTSQQHQRVPPGHILVEFGEAEVGLLAPFRDNLPMYGIPQQRWWRGLFVKPIDLVAACAHELAQRVRGRSYVFQEMEGDVADDVKAGRDTTPHVGEAA